MANKAMYSIPSKGQDNILYIEWIDRSTRCTERRAHNAVHIALLHAANMVNCPQTCNQHKGRVNNKEKTN